MKRKGNHLDRHLHAIWSVHRKASSVKQFGLILCTLVVTCILCLGISYHAAAQEGTKKWSYTTGGVPSSPAISTDGTIYNEET